MNECKKFVYDWPRPVVTVDAICVSIDNGKLKTLVIERGKDPFKGKFAWPGGHVDKNEDPDVAVMRELLEETHVHATPLQIKQLDVQGKPGRDPRGHYITIPYLVFLRYKDMMTARADDDAHGFRIFEFHPGILSHFDLAFDHADIFRAAYHKVMDLICSNHWVFLVRAGRWMLDDTFSATDLREIVESAGGGSLDPANWHREIRDGAGQHHVKEVREEPSRRRQKLYEWAGPPLASKW